MFPNRFETSHESPVSLIILGCGSRGRLFSDLVAQRRESARVMAVADPDVRMRNLVADQHGVPADRRFASWEDALDRPRLADAAIVTLMDRLHAPAALAAMRRGYHLLLEKPMAVTLDDCIAIDAERARSGRIVSICHSLRYHAVYRRAKELIEAGEIGEIMSIDQLEGVDPVHQAHSFVRGNWANSGRSTFMLLAKSCHDIDILIHLVGSNCNEVSSFGSLLHFTAANRPAGAPDRCIDGCPHDSDCPYSANKDYRAGKGWSREIGWDRLTQAERDGLLRTSRYGLCVYNCDNDAVDHQVATLQFASGATGTFTMTAFAPGGRHLRVHGARGYLSADIDRRRIELHRFWGPNREPEIIELPVETGTHGGADDHVIGRFIEAIRKNDPSRVLTGSAESLRTHAVVFAAERARHERSVVRVNELLAQTSEENHL